MKVGKDAVQVGVMTAGFLGVIVYTQYKYNSLKKELDGAKSDIQKLAKYIEALESRLGHHHVGNQLQNGEKTEQKTEEKENKEEEKVEEKKKPRKTRKTKEDSEEEEEPPKPRRKSENVYDANQHQHHHHHAHQPRVEVLPEEQERNLVEQRRRQEQYHRQQQIRQEQMRQQEQYARQQEMERQRLEQERQGQAESIAQGKQPMVQSNRRNNAENVETVQPSSRRKKFASVGEEPDDPVNKDLENIAKKSAKKKERQNAEGRDEGVSKQKERMARSRQLAIAMQQKREAALKAQGVKE